MIMAAANPEAYVSTGAEDMHLDRLTRAVVSCVGYRVEKGGVLPAS